MPKSKDNQVAKKYFNLQSKKVGVQIRSHQEEVILEEEYLSLEAEANITNAYAINVDNWAICHGDSKRILQHVRGVYKVSWLQKGHQILVNEQCKIDFRIG